MSDENENKGREDDAFSKEDVSVVLEEEEEEEEQEGLLKEERNENHRPNHEAQTKTKKYKSEKSVKFLFREATKARNEHMVNSTKKNNSKGKVVNLEYEKEREDNEEDFSTPGDSKDSAQTMMKEEDSLAKNNNNNAKGHRKRRKEHYVLPATQRPDSSNTFPMMGIPVAFPKGLTPLIPQKIVMSKVLQALKTKQHALVESPTGTGKSLALLCASLAFQKEMRRQIWEKRAKIGATPENKGLPDGWRTANGMFVGAREAETVKMETGEEVKEDKDNARIKSEEAATTTTNNNNNNSSKNVLPPDGGIGAKLLAKMGHLPGQGLGPDGKGISEPIKTKMRPMGMGMGYGNFEENAGGKKYEHSDPERMDNDQKQSMKNLMERLEREEEEIPRIFLCSRTHSQIAQLARELKRCPYRPNFSVLGSRQQFCPAKKTDEECQEMTRGCVKAVPPHSTSSKCAYFNRQAHLLDEMRNAHIWDIEDLKYAAEEHEACTFYVTKELYKDAEFVLCPYNYIFDEGIRAAMDIDLTNAAIIIDEGHNIEDVCREGASVEVYEKDLERYLNEIGILVVTFPEALPVKNFLIQIAAWISRKMKQRQEFDRYKQTRTISDPNVIIEELWDALCNPKREEETLDSVLKKVQTITAKQSKTMQMISEQGEKVTGVLGMQAMRFANEIATKFSLFKKYSNDYVLCIAQFAHDAFSNPADKPKHDEKTGGFALWCLRPAVAFERVAEKARCVILTSGTLSPTSSLEGELGVPFPIKVDAPHVVPNNQIFVESLDTLGAITRRNLQSSGQDFSARLGDMLLRYCKHIPGGVLVFLPSYELIQRISDEWFHTTGHHAQISKHKKIVFETGGSRGFDETLEDFRDGLKKKGSLLFAVFRGKCSEGLDFKDNAARAVFCIGIPFPNLGDVKVNLKKQFNSSAHGAQKNLLDGNRWYEHQAFRAYNQALGRCVRHLHDYAAIFLVDQRFCHNRENINLISKWVRGRVRTSGGANESVGMLNEFFQTLQANPPEENKVKKN